MKEFIHITERVLIEMHQREMGRAKRLSMKEDIYVKKNPETQQIIVFSDKEDKSANAKETISLAKDFRKLGLDWDRSLGHWVGDYSKLQAVNELIKKHNRVRSIVDDLEKIEEFVQASDAAPSQKDNILDKLDGYIEELANATDQVAMAEAIQKYLSFYKKFYKYSLTNTWLIFIQRPSATQVAGFNKWKSMHRAVNKGAKAIYIYAPITSKVKDDDVDVSNVPFTEVDKAAASKTRISGFRLVPVFDIADTTATSEKGNVPATPQWFSDNEPSEVADQLSTRLKEFAESHDIKITKDPSKQGEKGFSAGGHINLTSDISGVAEASTLVHEIAHELLHWKGKSLFHIDDEETNTREMKELQAEAVSFTVMKYFDLPVEHHPTYLALWKANKEKIRKNLDIITKCARYIIDGVNALKD